MSVKLKIFGLASSVVVFTGMAYGQSLTCGQVGAGLPGAASISPQNPIELRAEGMTELVSDVVIPCNAAVGAGNAVAGNVTSFMTGAVAVTSKGVGSSGGSEAILAIQGTTAGGVPVGSPVYVQGSVAGTQVNFNTVNFPTAAGLLATFGVGATNFTIQISNIRVNVSGSYPAVPQPVTETVFAGAQGVAALFQILPITVGYVRNGLIVTGASGSTATGAGQTTALTAAGITTFQVCQAAAAVNAFSVTVGELFAGAFKVASYNSAAVSPFTTNNLGLPGLTAFTVADIPGTESGSLVAAGTLTGSGVPNSATRIKFVFNNIPTNATISVPITLLDAATGGQNLTLVLNTNGETSADPFGAPTATKNFTNQVALTAASGSATAIYEVTIANLAVIKTAPFTAFVTYTANTVSAPAGPITVTVSYAPSPATNGAAAPSPIPTVPYFANTGTPFNGSTFTVCQTTLLFPFVTNQAGFETGIAIANAGLDNLGTTKTPSVATSQAGACTIFFYGSTTGEGGAQPPAPTAPNFPASTKTPATIAPGTTHADTLTGIVGGPFQGYAIASCPFLYAHGYAFIETGIGTSSALAEGYLADVINANRTSNVNAGGAVGSSTPETSGQ